MKDITGKTKFCELLPRKAITPLSIIFCRKNMIFPKSIDAKTGPTIKQMKGFRE